MIFSRNLTIYYKFLLLLIIISVIPLLTLGIGIASMDRTVMIDHSARELTTLAGIVANELHLTLNDLQRDSRVMASIPGMEAMGKDIQKTLLEKFFLNDFQFSILRILTLKGGTASSIPQEESLFINTQSFQTASVEGLQSWSITPFSSGSQRFFTIYTPIRNGEQSVIGVLVCAINMVDLTGAVKKIQAGRSQALVVDTGGQILLHPEQEKMQHQETGPWQKSLIHKKMVGSGTINYRIAGEQYDVGYASIVDFNWTVLVQRPDIEVTAPGQKAFSFTIMVMILTTLMVIGALSWLVSLFTNPIRKLSDLARAFAEGDVSVPLPEYPSGEDEIGSLIKAIGDMRCTVRKKTEELRDNQEKYKALFDTVDDAIFLYDSETFRIEDANESTSRIYGYSREELLGMSCLQFSAEVEESRKVAKQIEDKGTSSIPYRHHKSKNGIDLYVQLSGYKIMVRGRELFFAVSKDITNQVEAEKENEKLQEQLKHSQKLESIGQLAGGIAHDFNNQLAGILGYAELLSRNINDEKLKKYADRIQQGAQNGAKLTQQLLSFARKGQYVLEVLDLNEILDEIVGILSHTIDKRIQIVLKKNVGFPTIHGDFNQIQNALLNISLNARDAIAGAGCISIETRMMTIDEQDQRPLFDLSPGSYICIRISDDGSGIEESIQKRIFEPFFTTKGVGKGTGMGLSAAYGAVKHHGGDLLVESSIGTGSDFYVYLPYFETEKDGVKEINSIIKASQTSGILIVDDDETIQAMLSETLATLGYKVFRAGDGETGLQRYMDNKSSIDLVILDMIMPHKGGEELYHLLKKENPQLKILISSGYSPEESSISNIIDDETLFIQKPFTINEMSKIISEMLG